MGSASRRGAAPVPSPGDPAPSRGLPFVMVHYDALDAIRASLEGLRRARGLGLYVDLCRLANEQRADGGHERLWAAQPALARRVGVPVKTLRPLLHSLAAAGAVGIERHVDERGGSLGLEYELLRRGRRFARLTLLSLDALTGAVGGASRLAVSGLLVTLAQAVETQQHGPPPRYGVELTRREASSLAGLELRTFDRYIALLERAQLVSRTRRTGEDGNLPSLWAITQPPHEDGITLAPSMDGGGPVAPSDRDIPPLASETPHPGRQERPTPGVRDAPPPETGEAGPRRPRRPAPSDSGTMGEAPLSPPYYIQEDNGKNSPPPSPSQSSTDTTGDRGGDNRETIALCQLMQRRAEERTGPHRAQEPDAYPAEKARWEAAVATALSRYPAVRLRAAVEHLHADRFLGSRFFTWPALLPHLDEVIVRAGGAGPSAPTRPPSFAAAWPAIERAVRTHGARGAQAGLAQLAAEDERLAAFARRVGWQALCAGNPDRARGGWAAAWAEICAETSTGGRDAA